FRRNFDWIISLTFGMAFVLLSLKFFVLLLPPELIIVLVYRMIRLAVAVHRVFVEAGLTVGIAAHGMKSSGRSVTIKRPLRSLITLNPACASARNSGSSATRSSTNTRS